MGELKRVKKLDCIERLNSYFAHLIDVKAFVAIIFDEVVETLAERLEDEAHIAHHSAEALFRLVDESLFEVNNSFVTASLLLQILKNLCFEFSTFSVSWHGANDFDGICCLNLLFTRLLCYINNARLF